MKRINGQENCRVSAKPESSRARITEWLDDKGYGWINAGLATARKTVELLNPATLAKAFRGELVPQEPADERAAVMLERVKLSPPESRRRSVRPSS